MNYFGEKLDLGIQVVNYKTKNYLITCLEDLLDNLKGSEIAFHIFVLDNASEDDLSDLEIKHKDDPISFFYSDKNGGFGYGHNVLAKKYTADYILLVNPDIRLVKNTTIRHLYDCISSSDEIKVVGVNTHSHWDHGNKIPLLLTRMWLSVCKDIDKLSEVAWVQGSFFIIEKKVFDQLQGFDEQYFLYKEEEDLQLRIRLLGNKILYNPNISIDHIWGMNSSRWKCIVKSNIYFINKWLFHWNKNKREKGITN